MSRAHFEKLLEERGFNTKLSKDAINVLIERQYLISKSLVTALEESGTAPSEALVTKTMDELYPRTRARAARDQVTTTTSIPEIKNPGGPPVEAQLKYTVTKEPSAQKTVVSSITGLTTTTAPPPQVQVLDEEDAGPNDDTVFPTRKSKLSIEFRNISGEDGGGDLEGNDSRKRPLQDGEQAEEDGEEGGDRKRIRI